MAVADPAQRTAIAAHARNTYLARLTPEQRRAVTAPATAALRAALEAEADPDGTLDPAERDTKVKLLARARMHKIAMRSAEVRRGAARDRAIEALLDTVFTAVGGAA